MFYCPFAAGVGFEVLFQFCGLLFCLHGNGRVYFPWGKLGGMGYMPGIVSFATSRQVRSMANIEMRVRGCIPQNVNVMEM